jgi:hypothetical protein
MRPVRDDASASRVPRDPGDPVQRDAGTPSLDGLWATLGETAFRAFVQATAVAIVAELAADEGIAVASDRSPRGLARPDDPNGGSADADH